MYTECVEYVTVQYTAVALVLPGASAARRAGRAAHMQKKRNINAAQLLGTLTRGH